MSFVDKFKNTGKKHSGLAWAAVKGDRLLHGMGGAFFTVLGVWVKDPDVYPFEYVLSLGYIFSIIALASAVKNIGYKLVEAQEKLDMKKAVDESYDKATVREIGIKESHHQMEIIQTKSSIQSEVLELLLDDVNPETPPEIVQALMKSASRIRGSLQILMIEIKLPFKNWIDSRYADHNPGEVVNIPDSADSIDSKLGLGTIDSQGNIR